MHFGHLALPLALVLAACQAAGSPGASCARNSECAEPLVCAGAACRDACADARDCTVSYSCVTFHGAGVCIPPAQPVPCVFNADCGALFCRSGQCVQQCTTDHDCDRGTCDGGHCSEPVTTPAMPDASTSDAGAQCPAHQVLCQTDARCHDLMTDPTACGRCANACPSGGACEGGGCVCAGMPCAPANDHCADATEIVLDAAGHGSGIAQFAGATADLAPCFDIMGPDVFFRVEVPARAVLTAITPMGAFEPDIMDRGCGAPSSDCGDVCSTSDLEFDVAVVDPGPAWIAVRSTPAAASTAITLQVHVLPIGDVAISPLATNIGVVYPDDPAATATVAPTTREAGCGHADAHAFYWLRCGTIGTSEDVTACAPAGSGLVLEALTPPGGCSAADATGCVTVPASGPPATADVFVVHAATGTSVTLDAQIR